MKLKARVKKYRAILVMLVFLVFNMLSSIYFGADSALGFNLIPMSVGEWVCDIVSRSGQYFALMMGIYDLMMADASYKLAVKRAK